MKKLSMVLISLLLISLFTLVGCGKNKTAGEEQGGDSNTQEQSKDEEKGSDQPEYPTRAIEIIAGGGPGGGTDTFSRAVAKQLSDILGVNVNVVNKPGAGGSIAAQAVASAPADGYTLLPTNSDTHVNMATGRTPNYLTDGTFHPLANIHTDIYTIAVKSGSKYADIDQLVAEAKANPGEITIGGIASKGLEEFTVTRFEKAAGIDLNYIPYDEAGKSLADLQGGHIDLLLENVGSAMSLIEAGKTELVIVFAEERLELFPDIPTTVEKGWDLTVGLDRGFFVHDDTPDYIKKKLEEAIKEAVNTEEYKAFADEQMMNIIDGWKSSEEFEEYMLSEIETYKGILKELEN